jgi:hypothetical protein
VDTFSPPRKVFPVRASLLRLQEAYVASIYEPVKEA